MGKVPRVLVRLVDDVREESLAGDLESESGLVAELVSTVGEAKNSPFAREPTC